MKIHRVIPLLTICALGACSTLQTAGKPTEEETPIAEIDARIAEAMETASNANKAISEVEVAAVAPVAPGPGMSLPPTVVLPAELEQLESVSYTGPIENFLKALAERIDYRFDVVGDAPASQKIITVQAENRSLYRLARDAGAQAHGYANIAILPETRTIEIRYGG